jgi:hypothetical protein
MEDLKRYVQAHIEQKFAAASIETSPFPHLIIENFWPDDVYAQILSRNLFAKNAGTEWISRVESRKLKTGTPYEALKQINFHKNDHFEANQDDRLFWDGIAACFLTEDHWFERLVMAKYPEYFSIRFGDFVSHPEFFSGFRREFFLQRHEPGYYIGPHTDIPTRVFTCIFSFAARPGFDEFGTQLLAPRNPLHRCWGNNHYKPDGFEVVKTAPYKPNNFLLFFKTRQSFHAVRDIDDTVPNQRYGAQFQFYEKRGGVFEDLSVPDLMTVQHSKEGVVTRIKKALALV